MRRYRSRLPIISAFMVTLLLSVILISPTVGAFSLSSFIPTSKFNRVAEIQAKTNKVKERAATVVVVELETKKIAKKKVKLEKDVKKLESEIVSLNSMFVRINRYAPDASGNAYAPGYCTYGVKQWRPDIGNYWGDAKHWYNSAEAEGWNVGLRPKINAIGVSEEGYYGHVFLVTGIVNGGASIKVKDMNYSGLWNITERVIPATGYKYIYELD